MLLERQLIDGRLDLLHRAHDDNDAGRDGFGKRVVGPQK